MSTNSLRLEFGVENWRRAGLFSQQHTDFGWIYAKTYDDGHVWAALELPMSLPREFIDRLHSYLTAGTDVMPDPAQLVILPHRRTGWDRYLADWNAGQRGQAFAHTPRELWPGDEIDEAVLALSAERGQPIRPWPRIWLKHNLWDQARQEARTLRQVPPNQQSFATQCQVFLLEELTSSRSGADIDPAWRGIMQLGNTQSLTASTAEYHKRKQQYGTFLRVWQDLSSRYDDPALRAY